MAVILSAVTPYTAVIFRLSAVFRFLAVTTLVEAVKPKYGNNFSAVSDFLFFGGNVNGDSKLGRICGT